MAKRRSQKHSSEPQKQKQEQFAPVNRAENTAPFFPGAQGAAAAPPAADLSDVKLALDSPVASELGANALTRGETIHFAPGAFAPHTREGRALLGHELAHVVQQREGKVAPTARHQGVAINHDATLEADARRTGEAFAAGTPIASGGGASRAPRGASAVIQGDFALAPGVARPTFATLTAAQLAAAIAHNSRALTDADEIGLVRDVLGLTSVPAAVDEALARAVARYQAQYGLTQNGLIDPPTAAQLARELEAEATFIGATASSVGSAADMALTPGARRMALRGQLSRTLGTLAHQGFVGDRLNPAGVTSVRAGDAVGGISGMQSHEFAGTGGPTADWLQFLQLFIFGFAPGSATRVNMTGNVATTSGTARLSRPGDLHWHLDTASATTPFYAGGGGLDTTSPTSRTMFDRPGGTSANGYAASFASAQRPALNRVTLLFVAESYLVRNNVAEYRTDWTAATEFDIAAGAVTATRGPVYETTGGGPASLRPAQRRILDARFPRNGIR